MGFDELKNYLPQETTRRLRLFKTLGIMAFAMFLLTLFAPFYIYRKSNIEIQEVYLKLIPLQKVIHSINYNSLSIQTQIQSLFHFEENHQILLTLLDIERGKIENHLQELEMYSPGLHQLISLPELNRDQIFELEKRIIQLIRLEKFKAAENLFRVEKFSEIHNSYIKKVQLADEIIQQKIKDYEINHRNWFDNLSKFFFASIIINAVLWWMIFIEFRILNAQKDRAQKIIEQERLKFIEASKMASLGELSGGIAHEINNPLAIIKASSDLLRMQYEANRLDDDGFKKYITKISDTVDRISKVVSSMKKFARNGEADEKENAPLLNIIENALELFAEKFKTKGIKIITVCDESISVFCHPIEIEQVLLNLASNSYDAICEFQKEGDMYIKIQVDQVDGMAQIYFSDSGPGVPEEISDRIFNAFFTTKKSGAGTGLGLAISKRILLEHNGDIRLEHFRNTARFVVELPLSIPLQKSA